MIDCGELHSLSDYGIRPDEADPLPDFPEDLEQGDLLLSDKRQILDLAVKIKDEGNLLFKVILLYHLQHAHVFTLNLVV